MGSPGPSPLSPIRESRQAAALEDRQVFIARLCVLVFIVGLVLSGLTAMPLQTQMDFIARWMGFANLHDPTAAPSAMIGWLVRVRDAITQINRDSPFIFYGDDWLAFGHIAIAIAFVPALRDPVKHRWLFTYGLVLCGLVIVWAVSVGPFRGIPWFWTLIDCSFGVVGSIPLFIGRSLTPVQAQTS